MRRAPDTIDPSQHEPSPGEEFAGGTIARMAIYPYHPESIGARLTIELTDGSVLNYNEEFGEQFVLHDALLIGAPAHSHGSDRNTDT